MEKLVALESVSGCTLNHFLGQLTFLRSKCQLLPSLGAITYTYMYIQPVLVRSHLKYCMYTNIRSMLAWVSPDPTERGHCHVRLAHCCTYMYMYNMCIPNRYIHVQ